MRSLSFPKKIKFTVKTSFIIDFSQWIIQNGPPGESCLGNETSTEKCLFPKIPNCIDRNVYCEAPPKLPQKATRNEIYIPTRGWLNIPNTKLNYMCNNQSWAFNYKTDPKLPSFYFTENINNITITCNKNGYGSFSAKNSNSISKNILKRKQLPLRQFY